MSRADVAASLLRLFDLAGVDRLYGVAAPGLDVTPAPAGAGRPCRSSAHRWVHRRPAGACLGPGRFGLGRVDRLTDGHLTDDGAATHRIAIDRVDDIVEAAHEVVRIF